MIRLLVGLGNPGAEYKQTRHNAGFVFLDLLAGSDGWLIDRRFSGLVKSYSTRMGELILLKPSTFMNRSGASVAAIQRFYKIDSSNLLVAHDELDLPEGCVRLKKGGGHGGHNGVRDIISQVGSANFFRLRLGIGRPEGAKSVSDYVLSRMGVAELDVLSARCSVVIEHLDLLLDGDLERFNAVLLNNA